jgi:putative acetyltransferase
MEGVVVGVDDPEADDVRRLLEAHFTYSSEHSPPDEVHVLTPARLKARDVSFFSIRKDGQLLAVGALKQLDETHGEVKSMHTAEVARGRGLGRTMVNHLLAVARSRGYERVSLETSTAQAYVHARALYESVGFETSEPFAPYRSSPNSVCMTLKLEPRGRPGC